MFQTPIRAGIAAAAISATTAFAYSSSQAGQNDAAVELTAAVQTMPQCDEAPAGAACNPAGLPERLTDYRLCSALSETRMLRPGEAELCMEAYLAVKLSFIAAMDVPAYRALPTEEQIEVNLRAYSAYRAWRIAHPQAIAPCTDPEDCAM